MSDGALPYPTEANAHFALHIALLRHSLRKRAGRDLLDADGRVCGQAATFAQWRYL